MKLKIGGILRGQDGMNKGMEAGKHQAGLGNCEWMNPAGGEYGDPMEDEAGDAGLGPGHRGLECRLEVCSGFYRTWVAWKVCLSACFWFLVNASRACTVSVRCGPSSMSVY